TPRTNRALSPSSPSEETSTSSAPPSISPTCVDWAMARALPRVAIRSISECGEPIPVGVERLLLFGQVLAASAGEAPPKKLSGTPTGIGPAQLSDVRSAALTLGLCFSVQPEQLPQRTYVQIGLVAPRAPLHPQSRLVQQPRSDRLRHYLEPLPIGLA